MYSCALGSDADIERILPSVLPNRAFLFPYMNDFDFTEPKHDIKCSVKL